MFYKVVPFTYGNSYNSEDLNGWEISKCRGIDDFDLLIVASIPTSYSPWGHNLTIENVYFSYAHIELHKAVSIVLQVYGSNGNWFFNLNINTIYNTCLHYTIFFINSSINNYLYSNKLKEYISQEQNEVIFIQKSYIISMIL